MILNEIQIRNYRNIEKISTRLNGGVNVVCGENAEGKTNFLESVWMLTGGKSFRSSRDAELVRHGEEKAVVEAGFFSQQREQQIKLEITGEGREISLNRAPFKRASSFAGCFCCVCFAPGNMALVSGPPSERRRFLDTALCQLYPSYMKNLKRLSRLTAQKNSLLKNSYGVSAALDLIETFDEDLAAMSAEITAARIRYLEMLTKGAADYYATLSSGKESIDLKYRSTLFKESEATYQNAIEAMKKSRADDMRAGFCTVGPHRDEIEISLCGESGKSFGSQGQKRSIVLALKLAEADTFETVTAQRPVLLLDDVLSELDEKRQTFLIDCLRQTQSIITGCDESAIKSRIEAKIFKISGGKLV